MNFNPSFVRKIGYLCAIAALLYPLFILGEPGTVRRRGGTLAQLRSKYDLSQAKLGEIDPAGESMKLATLGMRGVAAAILWNKSIEYKKKKDWDKLSATLNQITKLQPNYSAVWESQAHNLSYNVSVEFDDYRHRYHWVKKGIDFLIKGTQINNREPRLMWTTGWFFGQKVGRADEHKQFRRMFRTDRDFHDDIQPFVDIDRNARGADNRPDNWLVGRLWFLRGQEMVDQGIPIRGKSPLVFHNQVPMSRINYSVAIEDEGVLDEKAELAWRLALEEYLRFGDRQIPTSWGEVIRLNDYDRIDKERVKTKKDFDDLAKGAEEALYQEKLAALSSEERRVIDLPLEKRTPDTFSTYYQAQDKLRTMPTEVAGRVQEPDRVKALRFARQLETIGTTSDRIRRYREQVNYDYWKMRCEAEQKRDAVQARNHMFEGNRLKGEASLDEALKEYEQAWVLWANIFKEFPALEEDRSDDLVEAIEKYRDVLLALDKKFPEDFVLNNVLERKVRRPTDNLPTVQKKDESKTDEAKLDTPKADGTKADEKSEAKEPGKSDEKPAVKSDDKEAKPETKDQPKPDDKESKKSDGKEPAKPDGKEPESKEPGQPDAPKPEGKEPSKEPSKEPTKPEGTEPTKPEEKEPAKPEVKEPASPDKAEPPKPESNEPAKSEPK